MDDTWASTSYVKNPSGVIQTPNSSGITPLHNAVKYRHSDIVEVLLEAGAKLTKDELHQAILGPNSIESLFLSFGLKIGLTFHFYSVTYPNGMPT